MNPYPTAWHNFINSIDNATAPTSGLRMEMLGNGITREKIADLLPRGQSDVNDFVDMRFCEAIAQTQAALLEWLAANGINFQYINAEQHFFSFTQTALPANTSPVGLKIVRNVAQTPYSRFKLSTIYVKIADSGLIDVSLRDSVFQIVQTWTINANANTETAIAVNLELADSTYFVTIDTPNIRPIQGTAINGGCVGEIARETMAVLGFDGFTTNWNSYGIRIVGGLVCNPENVVTALLPVIKQSILYKGGELIQSELTNSQRTNNTTIFGNLEEAIKLANDWREKSQSLLNAALLPLLPTLRKNEKFCFVCSPSKWHIKSVL